MGSKTSGRRKPSGRKIIEGTFRKDRNPEHEPEPEKVEEVPNPPSYLGHFAKALWKKLAGEMVRAGILTTVDIPALEMLCASYEEYREARDAVYTTQQGKPRTLRKYMRGKNSQTMPEYNAMKNAFATYKSFMVEFGLSPASRNRIEVKPRKGEKDKDEEEMKDLVND
jgi:P27 family predicted phage terminase small subunit